MAREYVRLGNVNVFLALHDRQTGLLFLALYLYRAAMTCQRSWTDLSVLTSVCLAFSRDFAYVARDKNTHVLKCHVFQCDSPAEAIAASLNQICSKVRLCLCSDKSRQASYWGEGSLQFPVYPAISCIKANFVM